MAFIQLSILWILYFILHSVLAGSGIKYIIKNKLSVFEKYYRILYNIIALVLLIFLLLFQGNIDDITLILSSASQRIIGYSLGIAGVIVGALAFKNYSSLEFAGLDFREKLNDIQPSLCTSGLNIYVRHPLYFATLLMVWGYFIIFSHLSILIMCTVMTAYLIIGTKNEEKKLIKEFGKEYEDYILNVPMLLPIKILRRTED